MHASLTPPSANSNLRSLHLLRALLREASYLPDSNARLYFRRYIVNRFRAYQPASNASPSIHAHAVEKKLQRSPRRRHASIIDARTAAMQRKGVKGLNYLRRANQGNYVCLEKIMYFAYGRMGARKYRLLEHLLRPDDPDALTESSPLQQLYYSNERCLSFFDAPTVKGEGLYSIAISKRYARLKAAVETQSGNGVALGREIKRASLVTPINNIWQRSMPIKRARGNVRRWYAETMTRLLPPLPDDEFDAIQAMADGTRRIGFVKPRTPATELSSTAASESEQFSKLVHEALVLAKPSLADKRAQEGQTHHLKVRFMRRLYGRVAKYCSKMVWNEQYNKWQAVWGRGLDGVSRTAFAVATKDDLFAGVDAQGHLLREKAQPAEAPISASETPTLTKKKKHKFTAIPFYIDYLPPDHPTRKEVEASLSRNKD